MRVSLRNQYSNFLYNLQDTQSKLMDLNMQASSQKRINNPSDDPVGTARVLNYRSSLASIDQYRSNIDTAKGWLGLADESMIQVSTILTKLKGLAEQGASGTMTASDREATSYEVRQLFSQLVNLGNTRFEGNAIFGGQKFDESAFEEALMVYDQDGNSLGLATGLASHSFVVQFLGAEGTVVPVSGRPDCRFSKDGGATWETGTWDANGTLNLGGVSVNLPSNHEVTLSPPSNTSVSQGSWLTIAPTAVYKGDHESQSAVLYTAGDPDVVAQPLGGFEKDVKVSVAAAGANLDITVSAEVNGTTESWTTTIPDSTSCIVNTPYGQVRLSGSDLEGAAFEVKAGSTGVIQMGVAVNAEGRGLFSSDVMVRIEESIVLGTSATEKIKYSYSIDGGVNWSEGHTASNSPVPTPTTPPDPPAVPAPVELLVPGGKLVLTTRGAEASLVKNAQFVIHPQTAAHNVEISAGQYLRLNNVGAEIFGGYYENGTQPVFSDSDVGKNIMVTVGKLVAALENNNQQGCAEALDGLKTGHEYFTTQLASVGARENRLDVADTVLSGLKLNETERMSNVEDADLATLLTELANQQLSYEAVLKSSSMIMKMSLVNYL
ncbi:flagellar hook-associated protein 3 FlgL [Desulfomicrobium norvegicum]|uniref:Flagellar hook-associated protein 3 FlgL n=1 Tax=Desulfomicrobium norvegicum (strain DSM 1741 / NCIMB 8310) TaxID=52561 RepID=A0A8G2FCY7_DESNO|nr:flagellar hook-associated protein FlgL [Desulfomicrobium norvegicum]SFL32413.1 flagellar hook-associated protein 3 FlgL [Desulfomicrobium norvegicum]